MSERQDWYDLMKMPYKQVFALRPIILKSIAMLAK